MSQYVISRVRVVTQTVQWLADTITALEAQLPITPPGSQHDQIVAQLRQLQRFQGPIAAEDRLWRSVPAAAAGDSAVERILLAWLWSPPRPTASQLLAEVKIDPIIQVTGATVTLTNARAAAAVATIGSVRPTSIAPLTQAVGADAVQELAVAALRKWLQLPAAQRPSMFRDVCVLLPLRLETLFRKDGGQWTMLLRIVPSEASVRRDDPVPTPTEIKLLTGMWQSTYAALSPTDRAKPPADWLANNLCPPAWELFCSQVSAPRAAFLTGAFPPTVTSGTVTVSAPAAQPHAAPPNRIGGFPKTIQIWCAFGDDDPTQLASNTVDTDALVFDVLGGRAESGEAIDEADRWWVSWQAAKDVGLGVERVLPDGHTPSDITALYAIGLSEDNPAEHFRGQIDAGELAILPLGAPTNAVDGAQAASLGQDAVDWRGTAADWMSPQPQTTLGLYLTGDPSALPLVPEPNGPDDLDSTLVRALWPALWGRHLRDIWGFGEDADTVGLWAGSQLRPEGPLPPIRIAEQPYGLLPTSQMTAFAPAAEEGAFASCERRMLETLIPLRDAAEAAARAHGTAVGADTAGLLDLLGHDALSPGYAQRLFLPTQLWAALWTVSTGSDFDAFTDVVREMFVPGAELLRNDPARMYLAGGEADPLSLPLVVPTTWPSWFWRPGEVDPAGHPVPAMSVEDGMARLINDLLRAPTFTYDYARELWQVLPDSLLIRLLLYADLLGRASVVAVNSGATPPILEPLLSSPTAPTRLRVLASAWSTAEPEDHPAGFINEMHREGLDTLFKRFSDNPAPNIAGRLERALRACLDTATHRVDPWLTGMAQRRLDYLVGQSDTRFRIGVYGWVDGPIRGAPGPTTGGLLHAPSYAQALTAVILRDKQISDHLANPGGRDLWSMQLDSDRIRLAAEIADEVRIGAHLYEAVGRQVERIVASASAVAALRTQFPLRTAQPDAGRVCSGLNALAALLSASPPVPLTSSQTDALKGLRNALDAYGDLLVAEAVHQVVSGHAELAGAAMDAAAGLGSPPTLAFTQTPLAGEPLTSAVVTAVPYAAAPTGAGAAPTQLADASVCAAVQAATGPAAAWTWGSVTLADLGLTPADTLVLSADLLIAMAAHRLGSPPTTGTGNDFHRRARNLVQALGSQPALASDIAKADDTTNATVIAALDADILSELRARYTGLRTEAQNTINALTVAADPGSLTAALRRALRWGITPMVGPDEQQALLGALLDGTTPTDPLLLPSLASRAAQSLSARLKSAPAVDAREPIGRSVAELAAPEGQLAVLARMPLGSLVAVSGLTLTADPKLDTDWLPVISAVRPHVARLEAVQLSALTGHQPGFSVTCSAPGDHWRTAALAALAEQRMQDPGAAYSTLPRFVAGYGLANVWSASPTTAVAVGLLDSWAETVPRQRQTTTAAFGFNAPAARAPQAILIAVPPDLESSYSAPASEEELISVLADTRRLAHARAVRAEDLGELLTALPTAMLDASGDTGIKLDGTAF